MREGTKIRPWQRRVLDMIESPGRLQLVMGRRTGKSMLMNHIAEQYMNNPTVKMVVSGSLNDEFLSNLSSVPKTPIQVNPEDVTITYDDIMDVSMKLHEQHDYAYRRLLENEWRSKYVGMVTEHIPEEQYRYADEKKADGRTVRRKIRVC